MQRNLGWRAPPTVWGARIDILPNRIEFTEPRGRITTLVNVSEPMALIRATETGIGIAEDELMEIFELSLPRDGART